MTRDTLILYGSVIFVLAVVAWASLGLSNTLSGVITGYATSNGTQTEATVTVNEFISLTLQEGFPVAFGNLDPGVTNSSATTNPSNMTIGGETNVGYNITFNGTSNFVSEGTGAIIGVGNMTFDSTNVSETLFVLNTDVTAYEDAQTCPCGTEVNDSARFFIDIPIGQQAASDYAANVTITVRGS